ncbi:lipopolysaccharide heptosyltransferase I [Propionivibrio sp.]|uniref:lipopolysaccharide heptosyltransferase I n=1 Tax=Propionivibrio sp. TaxID=2212460 RepID=UPI003BF00EF4
MQILLIKTSSMGDLVHNCPVVTDILTHYPDARIDWVAEEDYQAIPRLHPGVRRVIPVAWRRWRKHLLQEATWREMGEFKRSLQEIDYDMVFDTQGLWKSVAIARLSRNHAIVGGDRQSIKEGGAALFYDKALPIAKSRHVIDRCRAVAAGALGYPIETPPHYGIRAGALVADWLSARPYAVLMHAASRPEKLWADAHWIEVGQRLSAQGITSVLPWGSQDEKARSQLLAAALDGAIVPPRMALDTAARFLAGSALVVGLDTGFTHFAAALGRPTIGIFCDSDSDQAAVFGDGECASFGKKGNPPTLATVIDTIDRMLARSRPGA